MFDSQMQEAFEKAKHNAAADRHEHIWLEHIIYALLDEDEFWARLAIVGVRPSPAPREFLDDFLDDAPTSHFPPTPSKFVAEVLENAKSKPEPYTVADFVGDILSHASDIRFDEMFETGGEGFELFVRHVNEDVQNGEAFFGNVYFHRAEYIAAALRTLCKRERNNVLFIGEQGAGADAVLEELIRQLVTNAAPRELWGADVFLLNIPLLMSRCKYKGDFEERLDATLAHIIGRATRPVIAVQGFSLLFGRGEFDVLDGAEIFKQWLGQARVIAVASFDEQRFFARNRGFLQRFEQIIISEPDENETFALLKKARFYIRELCGGEFSDEALREAASAARRFFPTRAQPSAAFDLLDAAASAHRLREFAPQFLDAPRSAQDELKTRKKRVEFERLVALADSTDGMRRLREEVGEREFAHFEREAKRQRQIAAANSNLSGIDAKFIRQIAAQIVAQQAQSAPKADEAALYAGLAARLNGAVFGQEDAVRQVCETLAVSAAGLSEPKRPRGVFLFAGKSGVGKTELCVQLAAALGMHFERFDMSEYMERHMVARFIGSPPGYIGFESGGALTNAVRKNPRSVLLFDEIEKAHEEVVNVFLQLFDNATLTDGAGQKCDFRECVVVMTSNLGTQGAEMVGFAVGDGGASAGSGAGGGTGGGANSNLGASGAKNSAQNSRVVGFAAESRVEFGGANSHKNGKMVGNLNSNNLAGANSNLRGADGAGDNFHVEFGGANSSNSNLRGASGDFGEKFGAAETDFRAEFNGANSSKNAATRPAFHAALELSPQISSNATREISPNATPHAALQAGARGREKSELAIKEFFSPEFRNRLDAVIYFKDLGDTALREVALKYAAAMSEGKFKLTFSDSALAQILLLGKSNEFGARKIHRVIKENIFAKLAPKLLSGELGGAVAVDFVGGEFAFEF